MIKTYNVKHEAKIEYNIVPIDHSVKNGILTPHTNRVKNITFYYANHTENRVVYDKIFLSKDFIIDLYDQIQQIEGETFEQKVDNDLPF